MCASVSLVRVADVNGEGKSVTTAPTKSLPMTEINKTLTFL